MRGCSKLRPTGKCSGWLRSRFLSHGRKQTVDPCADRMFPAKLKFAGHFFKLNAMKKRSQVVTGDLEQSSLATPPVSPG